MDLLRGVPQERQVGNELVTIADRRARVTGLGPAESSLYGLARQWVYNNPNPIYSGPIEDKPDLLSVADTLPKEPRLPTQPDPSQLPHHEDPSSVEALKQRWKAVDAHYKKEAAENKQQQLQRLHQSLG